MSAHTRRRMHRYLSNTIAVLAITAAAHASAAQDEVQVRNERGAGSSALSAHKPGAESTSVTVDYADLNLGHTAGARTLYTRLKTAAGKVCNPAPGRDLGDRRDWNDCYSNAIDAAVAATGSPALAAIHSEQTGRGRGVRIASNE